MDYLEIVTIICAVLNGIFGLALLHFGVFSLVGIFKRKTFPETQEKLRYGVIIPARNEERVIERLIQSLRAMNYPQDKIDIFVVAHNCNDRTAELARREGAIVYEYNNENERTMGYAFRYLFDRIREDYGTERYDAFLMTNADNIFTENFLSKMNDAFVANGRRYVITSVRNSKNFNQNYMSCLYGLFFLAMCRMEARGRTYCGCSTRIAGTGYVFNSEIVKNGWEYVSLTEDWEFSADQISKGNKIFYCDEAEFFDEQPTTLKIMWRQRMRWAKGHMDVFFTRFTKVFRSIFTSKKRNGNPNKGSAYDIGVSIMPLGVIAVSIALLQIILLAFTPLFGYDAAAVWSRWGVVTGISLGIAYIATMLSAVILYFIERKRIGKVGFFKLSAAFLLWPFFLAIAIVMDVAALFIKKLEWKPIPHSYNIEKTKGCSEKTKKRKMKEQT